METPATYIYCNRFEESKSILICATRCAYSLGCKDWSAALSGQLRERIESEANEYAARKGVVINPDVWSPLQPRKRKRQQIGIGATISSPGASWNKVSESSRPFGLDGGEVTLASRRVARQGAKMSLRQPASTSSSLSQHVESKVMANEERISEVRKQQLGSGVKESKPKATQPKPRKRTPTRIPGRRAGKASNSQGTVYLVLDRSGRYREVKSEEEMKRIAIESAGKNRKGIRFARATLLEVEVMFRPVR